MLTTGSQKITVRGPGGTPLGILRVKGRLDISVAVVTTPGPAKYVNRLSIGSSSETDLFYKTSPDGLGTASGAKCSRTEQVT
jgi:hypothetical protein